MFCEIILIIYMKKALLLLFLTSLCLALPRFVFAQSDGVLGNFPQAVEEITPESAGGNGGVAGETYVGLFVPESQQAGLILQIAGCMEGVCTDKMMSNPQTLKYWNQKSIASHTNNLFYAVYTTKPASTAMGIQDLAQSVGLTPHTAYAQAPGIGYAGLAPILPIWRAFRNLAYYLLAVVMVVIGFMVMFRKKIDPKTVVTVQNAIPGIIISLLLITFSYAIVGFMIDLMYLSSSLIISMLVPIGKEVSGSSIFEPGKYSDLLSGDIGTIFTNAFGIGGNSVDDVYNALFGGNVANGTVVSILTGIGIGTFGLWAGGVKGAMAGFATGALLPILIILLIALIVFFRILFMLIGTYINIIVSLLTAPLQLLMGALPGNTAYSSWFSNLISNLIVFPTTIALLLVSSILATAGQKGTLWVPPLTAGSGMGLQGLVALGLLASIPNIVEALKEQFKAKAPINASVTSILSPAAGAVGTVGQFAYQAMFIKSALHSPKDTGVPAFGRAQTSLSDDKMSGLTGPLMGGGGGGGGGGH